ncbi:MAG: gluconeogenesis factor YvcK family protein [Patescibacteria group bacterium]
MKKVVVIGGGNGSAISINALKTFKDDVGISAVISMSDSGGSSGRLRKEFSTLPMGDILRAILAMSPYPYKVLRAIFNKNRFSESTGKLSGHNLGNMFLALANEYNGNFLQTIRALHEAVEAVGAVHPVTLEPSDLCVELSDGTIVIGEHEIDRPTYDRSLRIRRAWLQPTPPLYDGARKAIEEADVIVFGPGSLYCSIVATLVVEGMQDVLRQTNARFVYVVGNAYELIGETGPSVFRDFVSELEVFLPRPLDVIVCNNRPLSEQELERYAKKEWGLIQCDDKGKTDPRLVMEDFEKDFDQGMGLSPEKLGAILKEIIL